MSTDEIGSPTVEVQRAFITQVRDELAAIAYLNQLKIDALRVQTAVDAAGEKHQTDQIAELTLGIDNARRSMEVLEKKLSALPRSGTSQLPGGPLLQ